MRNSPKVAEPKLWEIKIVTGIMRKIFIGRSNLAGGAIVKVILSRKSESAAFTLMELLAVISIIIIVAALIIPAGSRMIESGRAAACTSKLRNLSQLFQQYRSDNNQIMYTNTPSWVTPFSDDGLLKYSKETECPSASAADSWKSGLSSWGAQALSSYSVNACAFYKGSPYGGSFTISSYLYFAGYETTTPIFMDGKIYGLNITSWGAANRLNYISLRHNNRANVAFMDGHIEALDQAGIVALQPIPTKH